MEQKEPIKFLPLGINDYEELPLTPRVRHLKSLHKKINITKEDIENDERMAYILSK